MGNVDLPPQAYRAIPRSWLTQLALAETILVFIGLGTLVLIRVIPVLHVWQDIAVLVAATLFTWVITRCVALPRMGITPSFLLTVLATGGCTVLVSLLFRVAAFQLVVTTLLAMVFAGAVWGLNRWFVRVMALASLGVIAPSNGGYSSSIKKGSSEGS